MTRTLLLIMIIFGIDAMAAAPAASSSAASSGPSSFGMPTTLYVDAYAYFGAATGKIQGQSESLSLNQQGVGLTVGPLFNGFLLGLGTDYRQVNNSKAPDSQIGSFKGTRWAPLVISAGYLSDSFLLKFDYEPMGTFHLTQPTYQGTSITYGSGGGIRATAMYHLGSGWMLGPQYESLTFSSRYDSQTGQTGSQALTLAQIGLTGAYVF